MKVDHGDHGALKIIVILDKNEEFSVYLHVLFFKSTCNRSHNVT